MMENRLGNSRHFGSVRGNVWDGIAILAEGEETFGRPSPFWRRAGKRLGGRRRFGGARRNVWEGTAVLAVCGKTFGRPSLFWRCAGNSILADFGRFDFSFASLAWLRRIGIMLNLVNRTASFLALGLLITGCDSRLDRVAAAEQKGHQAEMKHDRGEFDQAVVLAREVVNELSPLVGSDDPKTLHWRYNLGRFLRAAGKREDAIAEGRSLVTTSVRVLGESHEDTLYAQLLLASALREVNNSEGALDASSGEESERLYRALLQRAEKGYGAESTLAVKVREGLAILCGKKGDYQEAVKHHTILLEVQRMKLGNEAGETLSARMNLASALLGQKLFEPAQRELKTVYELRKTSLGEDHPETIRALDWLGTSYIDQGLFGEALPMLRDVWARKRKALGEAHRGSLVSGFNLAAAELKGGNREEAKRILGSIHQLALKNLGAGDSQTEMYHKALEMLR